MVTVLSRGSVRGVSRKDSSKLRQNSRADTTYGSSKWALQSLVTGNIEGKSEC